MNVTAWAGRAGARAPGRLQSENLPDPRKEKRQQNKSSGDAERAPTSERLGCALLQFLMLYSQNTMLYNQLGNVISQWPYKKGYIRYYITCYMA